MNTTINYELLNTLIILGIVLVSIMILATIYFVFALRKVSILTKKIDYLTEDATYKLEKLNVTVDALVKFSDYINVLETYLNKNTKVFIEYLANNKIEKDNKKIN
ncbi:MAG: hypothetical protein K2K73_03340 [Ureaplasma sp.]|nr:hypothetical protein [Ureaplasma sp.]